MQLLLAESPEVATAPETQIFAFYLDRFRRQWIVEHTGARGAEGRAGLSRLLSEAEFLEFCGYTARLILDRIAIRKPLASIVMEKSPQHALLVEWILSIFPDAWILHVIRDPRDTVASLLRAAWSWGADWAPRNPIDAGRYWKKHVDAAQRARGLTPNYREIAYEDLKRQPAEEFERILAWLDLSRSREFVTEAVERCSITNIRTKSDKGELLPSASAPAGFFGEGAVGGWRGALGPARARLVESVCFDTMRRAGYQPELARSDRRPPRILLHDSLDRVREAIDWQLQKLLFKL